jgi:hypothetical protein
MVALELEVMAKKMDRFGWERDRGSAAHDRLVSDWMDVLCDYPLDEVKAACREWVASNPRKMPNEGDILGLIGKARAFKVARLPKPSEPREEYRGGNAPTPEQKEKANELLQKMGFAPKRFGGEE